MDQTPLCALGKGRSTQVHAELSRTNPKGNPNSCLPLLPSHSPGNPGHHIHVLLSPAGSAMSWSVQSPAWVKDSLRTARATVLRWGMSLLEQCWQFYLFSRCIRVHPSLSRRAAPPHLSQPGAPDPFTAPACNKAPEKVRPRPGRRILLVSCHPAAVPHQAVSQTHPMAPQQSTASAFSSACSGVFRHGSARVFLTQGSLQSPSNQLKWSKGTLVADFRRIYVSPQNVPSDP